MPGRGTRRTLRRVNLSEPDPGAAATTDPSGSEARPGSVVPSPIDEAAAVLLRAEADEAAARDARERYRTAPIEPLAPRPDGVTEIAPGEAIFAVRPTAVLNAGRRDMPGYGGTLYLTATRLVLAGQVTVSIALADIVESALSGERLLLTLRDGEGVTLDIGQPRLLRAEIAAVRHWATS